MARGVPIVVFQKAIEGLNVLDERDVLVRDGVASAAATLRDIVSGRLDATLDGIGLSGAGIARAEHDPNVISAVLSRVLSGGDIAAPQAEPVPVP